MRGVTRAGMVRATAFFGALGIVAGLPLEHWVFNIAVFTLMYAALGVAWNLIGGYAGYTSLGHVAFFGAGAYALGLAFTDRALASGWEPFAALPLVGLGVAVVSLPIAWVALRTRTVVFAIVTLTLLFMVQALAFNLTDLTGGASGVGLPEPPFPAGFFERPFYLVMLVLLALAMLASWWIRNSRLGIALLAIRDDEDKARGVGVPTEAAKLIAFAASAAFTAMAGGAWAYYVSFVYPQFAVDPLISVGTVLMVFLGGRGTLWGPVLGAFLLVPSQQYLAYQMGGGQLYLIGYAAVFLVVILLVPQGIVPSVRARLEQRRARDTTVFDPSPSTFTLHTRHAGVSRVQRESLGEGTGGPILVVHGLVKRFGKVMGADHCSFEVPTGSITALIGPNGSGKTTIFNLITGYLPADEGTFFFDGDEVKRPRPQTLFRDGLARTFQRARVFGRLTVRENLLVCTAERRLLTPQATGDDLTQTADLMESFGLSRLADVPAAEISYGQRRLLEFAMVLMGRPRLVLLDEPTAGVNPTMIEMIEHQIREWNAQGVSFLVVEHDMGFVMRLCDPVIVLDQGAPIAAGVPAAIQSDPRVLDAYLGA